MIIRHKLIITAIIAAFIAFFIGLSLDAQTVQRETASHATNYWSKAHPEWPPLPAPPARDLPMAVYPGGVLFDDTHYVYPSNYVATNFHVVTYSNLQPWEIRAMNTHGHGAPDLSHFKRVVDDNGRVFYVNTNPAVSIDSKFLPVLEKWQPGTVSNLPPASISTNPPDATIRSGFNGARRLPPNIHILSPTFQRDLQQWKEENGLLATPSGGGDFADHFSYYSFDVYAMNCAGGGPGHLGSGTFVPNLWQLSIETNNVPGYISYTNYLGGLQSVRFVAGVHDNIAFFSLASKYPDPCSEHSTFDAFEIYFYGEFAHDGGFFSTTNIYYLGGGFCGGTTLGTANGDGSLSDPIWETLGGPGTQYYFGAPQPYLDNSSGQNHLTLDTGARMNFTFSSTTNLANWNTETNLTTDPDGIAAVDIPNNGADFRFFKAVFNSNCPPPSP